MKVLVIGSGGREHALAWSLRKSQRVDQVFVVPGNAGTASIATNLTEPEGDLEGLATLAETHTIDLTVVGPETPLARGVTDLFHRRGLRIFGPTSAAARIEASKAFAKELMLGKGIPCPDFKVFDDFEDASQFVSKHQGPVVVKADGLAAGKGVVVCRDRAEALSAVDDCMNARVFGRAGEKVLIEEYLEGPEVSVFAFSDGEHISPVVAACDYKRLLDEDQGPNTGGMGSYSPPELWTPQLARQIEDEVMVPTVRALAEEGAPYVGVLYAGLMLTSLGPKVLEFNCRLGDPEAQVVLPRLETDILEVLWASVESSLDEVSVEWSQEACVGIVMASGGYPGEYAKGLPIAGLEDLDSDALVFHAGTRMSESRDAAQVLTDGGRVLTVVGRGETITAARHKAYGNVNRIHFEDAHYRQDIGARASSPHAAATHYGA